MKTGLQGVKDSNTIGNGLDKLNEAAALALGAHALREFLPMIESYEDKSGTALGEDDEPLLAGSSAGVERVLALVDARVRDALYEAQAGAGLRDLFNTIHPAPARRRQRRGRKGTRHDDIQA